tara:strand:+ start:2759 stop:3817 length:1059 start_codon:yes stop_codon:yes gene_type:complete
MKQVLLASAFLLYVLPVYAHAQEFNAGFVQGLWYSQETFFVDDTVRIYVAIRNNTGSDLTGTVEFFDNDERIGRSTVSALDGRIIESWVDWEPDYGEHRISASISKIELHTVGETTEAIEVRSSLAEDVLFVDVDTDGDDVGNKNDIDDDGDGISDIVEQNNGTNPLVYDEPTPLSSAEASETEEGKSPHSETNGTGTDSSTSTAEGLEQYLTPSRADAVLESVTAYTQALKKDLDMYRAKRRAVQNGETLEDAVPEIEVDKDGFGEITRTDGTVESKTEKEKTREPKEKPEGFMGDLISFIGSIFGGIYTGVLAIISWTLGYPILIQLLLLFGILYGMYKIAKRLGGRPQQ